MAADGRDSTRAGSDAEARARHVRATPSFALRTHIVLVGLPGAGKTTVGAGLAKALNCPFVDLDAEIVRRTGRPIASIFASEGEEQFRTLEREATLIVRRMRPSIIAPGGGWVTMPETVALLRPPARLAYLRVDPATAARRLHRSAHLRPLLHGGPAEALERLLGARGEAYEASDWVIDTQMLTKQEVIEAVIALIQGESSP